MCVAQVIRIEKGGTAAHSSVVGFCLALSSVSVALREPYFWINPQILHMLPHSGPNLFWFSVLIFMGWLFSVLTLALTGSFHPLRKRAPSKVVFFAAFHEKIRSVFKCQSKETFHTIWRGTNRVLQKNMEEPTVFLMLVPCGAMDTANQMALLLVHCILIACQYPADKHRIKCLLFDGSKYSSHNDEWPFFYGVRKQLRFFGVAAIFAFENLHPQVVKTLQLLTSLLAPPYPESVLILVVDVRNRFTEHQKRTWSPNKMGKIFLQELLGPYVEHNELLELINQIGSRCILINPEGKSIENTILG